MPSFADTETTFAELRAHRQGDRFPEDDPAHAVRRRRETRTIELPSRDRVMTFDGKSYRLGFALPNCYFRTTIAYAFCGSWACGSAGWAIPAGADANPARGRRCRRQPRGWRPDGLRGG
ncbi:DUF1993 domain-containing protein [Burkholderia thailandensis]|uniref:DUF1993 domain-containing protein n=1 Tax=Burkholderia thailandensis TaxID=57975 RepID=UPI00217E1CBA|nr:DUF1993 domain-containing protein [Burkholderia thailandensis]MCS6512783.1 DUF1993 domain-containing protein [Burkholderia thailandensis]